MSMASNALAQIFQDVAVPDTASAKRTFSSEWLEEAEKLFQELQQMATSMGIGQSGSTSEIGHRPDQHKHQERLPTWSLRNQRCSKVAGPRTSPAGPEEEARTDVQEPTETTPVSAKRKKQQRAALRDQQNSDAKKRSSAHRKSLMKVQSKISRMHLSNAFLSPGKPPVSSGNFGDAFYVSLGECHDSKEPRPGKTESPKPGKADFRQHRRAMKKRLCLSGKDGGDNDVGVDLVVPKDGDLGTQMSMARQECAHKLDRATLARVRDAIRAGVPLDHIVASGTAGRSCADDLREVKRLLYLEDAFYG